VIVWLTVGYGGIFMENVWLPTVTDNDVTVCTDAKSQESEVKLVVKAGTD